MRSRPNQDKQPAWNPRQRRRARDFELLLAGRAFHFKTTPQGDTYFIDTLAGAYVGVRYYWGAHEPPRRLAGTGKRAYRCAARGESVVRVYWRVAKR